MAIEYTQVDKEFDKLKKHFSGELTKLRSGRANPDLVSSVKVDAYGQSMPLDQVSNINVVDPTLLSVQPWDKSIISEIEKALNRAEIGINPVVDGDLVRLPLPPLTQERREEYVKILGQKTEDVKISVRQVRKEVLEKLDRQKESGEISEDEASRLEKRLQEKVDDVNKDIEGLAASKESELMQV